MATNEEIIDCIQLINSENVGPITFYNLLEIYQTPKRALEALPSMKKFKLFPRKSAEHELLLAKSKDVEILIYSDERYPPSLKNLDDCPPVLYVKGNYEVLQNPLAVSIVGARNASINGRKTASRIAFELVNNDITIVSGMARGIDASAHKGAMYAKSQCGETIAVLGCGVDVIYPPENREIYEAICQNGAIVSEFLMGTKPQSQHFPRRNRIVSALSLGTLVVEANLKSGSLITANMANEQGKDVFAIPGSPNDGRALGPNKLIKEGAVLVENAEDIMKVIAKNNLHIVKKIQPQKQKKAVSLLEKEPKVTEEKKSILDYLNYEGIYVDEIIRASGMDATNVAMELLDLELSGKIERQTGNKVALIK